MNRDEALELIFNNAHLLEIMNREHVVLWQIVDKALNHPERADRWQTYAQLKELATQIAGKHAGNAALATSAHYEALMKCIDEMLPVNAERDEDDLELDAISEDKQA